MTNYTDLSKNSVVRAVGFFVDGRDIYLDDGCAANDFFVRFPETVCTLGSIEQIAKDYFLDDAELQKYFTIRSVDVLPISKDRLNHTNPAEKIPTVTVLIRGKFSNVRNGWKCNQTSYGSMEPISDIDGFNIDEDYLEMISKIDRFLGN